MRDKNEIIELIKKNEEVCKNIYEGNTGKAFLTKQDIIIKNQKVFSEFIELIPKLKPLGVDIPLEVILQQLKNLIEAYEFSDAVLLMDTLKYEINDSLVLYKEIIEELEKENIVI